MDINEFMKSRLKELWGDRYYRFWMAGFTLLMFGLQFFGGAYDAEYDGHPDEAAHFVSSLLVRDYLTQFPWPSPMPWALNYYFHYPKVAIGHWPPSYYAIQGAWWLLFPPGRESAMALNLLMGIAVMTLFWVLLRRLGPSPLIAGGAGVLMLSLPIMQAALSQVMIELPSLLVATMFLWALVRMQEIRSRQSLMVVWVVLLAAFAVKQTSVGLAAAPAIVLAIGGGWRQLPRGPLLVWPAVVGMIVGLLLLWQYGGSISQIKQWSGASSRELPWSFPQLLDLVGGGVLLAAGLGVVVGWRRREAVLVASLAVVASFAICSYYIRAFREPRHWIALAPPLILLAVAGYRWLSERSRWAPAVLIAVLAWIPHGFYRQTAQGYGALAAKVRLPARMLVSASEGWAEGPWIAVVALREPRPSSVVVRATKLLSSSGWNSQHYRSKVSTAEDVERILDEATIDLVIIHDDAAVLRRPMHHSVLKAAFATSATWLRCAEAGNLAAYCRQRSPRYPPVPLRFQLDRVGIGQIGEAP